MDGLAVYIELPVVAIGESDILAALGFKLQDLGNLCQLMRTWLSAAAAISVPYLAKIVKQQKRAGVSRPFDILPVAVLNAGRLRGR